MCLAAALAVALSVFTTPPPAAAEWATEALTGGERTFRRASPAEIEKKKGMFTDDAFGGMLALTQYAGYVEEVVRPREAAPGCEGCSGRRALLERAWQTVANEALTSAKTSGLGGFSQARWGGALEATLREAGGVVRSEEELQSALAALVARVGDPYTRYLRPPEFRLALRRPQAAELAVLERLYIGPGLQLGDRVSSAAQKPGRPAGWRVLAPLAGSPAEEAGVQPGDTLLAVDGFPVAGLDRRTVEALLRGLEGSQISLRIYAASTHSADSLLLERRPLPLPPVSARLLKVQQASGVPRLLSYLRIRFWSSDSRAAIAAALKEGEALAVDGYVIDLRNDAGGVYEESITASSFFLPCGAVSSRTVRGADAPWGTYVACELSPGMFEGALARQLTAAPVAILANGGTASASEVFAAALRDNGRARIFGPGPTFGKSKVQFYFPLGRETNAGGLKLTVEKWISPLGQDVGDPLSPGLTPDARCLDHPRTAGGPPGKPRTFLVDDCIRAAAVDILHPHRQLDRRSSHNRSRTAAAAAIHPPPAFSASSYSFL